MTDKIKQTHVEIVYGLKTEENRFVINGMDLTDCISRDFTITADHSTPGIAFVNVQIIAHKIDAKFPDAEITLNQVGQFASKSQ